MRPVPGIVCRCMPVLARESSGRLFLGGLWSGRLGRLVSSFEVCGLVEELVVFLLGDDVARAVEYRAYLNAQLRSLEISGEVGVSLEVDDVLDIHLALGMSPQVAVLTEYLALDMGSLADYQLAFGIYILVPLEIRHNSLAWGIISAFAISYTFY